MTVAPSTLIALQKKLTANLGTVNLGIVGDQDHVRSGGYHIGATTLRDNGMGDDYSLEYSIDRNATHDYACAIDIGGSADLLMTLGNRIVHALKNFDPRVYGRVRGTNAPFDGQSTDRRYDTENPNTKSDDNTQVSSDRNHIHIEVYRTLVTRQDVMDGLYAVLSGASDPVTGGEMASTEYAALKAQISALHVKLDQEVQDMLNVAVEKIQEQVSALHDQLDAKIDAAVEQVKQNQTPPV